MFMQRLLTMRRARSWVVKNLHCIAVDAQKVVLPSLLICEHRPSERWEEVEFHSIGTQSHPKEEVPDILLGSLEDLTCNSHRQRSDHIDKVLDMNHSLIGEKGFRGLR
eukprot:1895915-Amphidinium_carterae.1